MPLRFPLRCASGVIQICERVKPFSTLSFGLVWIDHNRTLTLLVSLNPRPQIFKNPETDLTFYCLSLRQQFWLYYWSHIVYSGCPSVNANMHLLWLWLSEVIQLSYKNVPWQDTNIKFNMFVLGQRGSWRADVLAVLSPHRWQTYHHHNQSEKSQSHGHHRSLRLVLMDGRGRRRQPSTALVLDF